MTLLWVPLCLGAQRTGQPLTLDPNYSAERLVREVFANDRCETIFNVRAIGKDPDGIGYFEGDSSIVGFDRGIILSTGRIADAAGPNNITNKSTKLAGRTSDPDLDIASRNGVFDRSGIEFDFIPLESQVVFRYTFASEEYCEYVGAIYNDIFGFFVSGPGYDGQFSNGGVNVARVPGRGAVVSVNTINDGRNSQFFLDNNPVGREGACRRSTGESPRMQSIQFDGQTTVLTAVLNVQPCETYHIRLVIADVSDDAWDSAVFLEAGSFSLGASSTLTGVDYTQEPLIAYEGCSTTTMRINRGPDSDPTREQRVVYRLGNTSVATNPGDFRAGSGEAIIPPGELFVDVPIRATADNLDEGEEAAWIVLSVPCACYSDSIKVLIRDIEPLEISDGKPFRYCKGGGSRLTAEVRGGVPPYSYEWSFGSTDPAPEVTETLPEEVGLRLTDACGQTTNWRATTQAVDPPTVVFPEQDLTACWDDTIQIASNLTGSGPYTLTYLFNGERQPTLELQDGQDWPVFQGGDYLVTEVRDQVCATAVQKALRVDFYRPVLNATYTDPSCFGAEDGTITGRHLRTVEPYSYQLNGEPTTDLNVTDLTAGTYELAVADALGCADSTTVVLLDPEPIYPVEIDCKQLRRPPLDISASGGVPPYSYSTDDSTFTEGRPFWRRLPAGEYYQLTIRDSRNCEIVQPEFYYPQAAAPPIQLPAFIPQEVGGSVQVDLQYRVPINQVFSYRWSPDELFDCPTCPNPTITAPFTQDINLVIRDVYGCVDSLTTYVAVDGRSPIFVPNVFSPDGDGNNDYVAVFGNGDIVERVVTFTVYTRWGEQVYTDADFLPNSARRGWDGQLRGRPALPGTYLWVAQVQLFDGTIQRVGGTTALVAR